MRLASKKALDALRIEAAAHLFPETETVIAVGMGTCGIGNGADLLYQNLEKSISSYISTRNKMHVRLKKTGCFGFCSEEPMALLRVPGKPALLLNQLKPKDTDRLISACFSPDLLEKLAKSALAKIEHWDFRTSEFNFGSGFPSTPLWNEIPFFKGQEKLVLRDCGLIDPENIEEYIAVGGYDALAKAISGMKGEDIIAELKKAKLRGRGGAGFPTGVKWELMAKQPGPDKYVICNADEGDPGAYMNRNEIESDPHMLLEGMAIGALAMGASNGFVYVRAEYPLAVERFERAIAQAKDYGLIGENILGSGFSFDLSIVTGAGAFVCGEETALIASAEGRAGRPMPRPPFPAQSGYLGKPTTINNVETWCNVPLIIARGGDYFSGFGTEKSAGTKVFSLVGKVKNTGLVELPLGSTLESIVYGMGEGSGSRKRIRAVQTGGPSGGCVPTKLFSTPVDYESLSALGAIMGSGGMVVMDQDNCMVDTARYFVEFTANESCGKCTPCREGLSQSLRILNAVSRGEARESDLSELETLANVVKDSALCGLGQTSANPVLTTLKYFRDEYEEHVRDQRCKAGVCSSLYLALCENSCPLHMNIPGYLQLLKEGRLEESFELTLRGNPFPGTIGRICHFHCKMRCRREALDEAVAQGEIHRYIADAMYKIGREKAVYAKLISEKLPPTGKKIAIIGAGPAGLTAAYYLVRLGHSVTVYDEHDKPGGIPRYGIPSYRLPRDVIDKETLFITKLGAKLVMKTKIGRDLSFADLEKANDAVIVAAGASEDLPLGIPGDELKGVIHGYDFLERLTLKTAPEIGERVVIVGAGNVAIDAARTISRLGSEVTVVYRREKRDMPANAAEIEGAMEEGIQFKFLCAPTEVLDDGTGKVKGLRVVKMSPGGIDESGRRKPVPTDKTELILCDTIISAVGERASAGIAAECGLETQKNGTVKADSFSFRTAHRKVYAIGDIVSGPATAAEAMGMALRASRAIDKELAGKASYDESRFESLFGSFTYSDEIPDEPVGDAMRRAPMIPVSERRRNFVELSLGYSGKQALEEAERCLRCDVGTARRERQYKNREDKRVAAGRN